MHVKGGKDNTGVLENVPSPKWIMKHYEEVVKGSQTSNATGNRKLSENVPDDRHSGSNRFNKSTPSQTSRESVTDKQSDKILASQTSSNYPERGKPVDRNETVNSVSTNNKAQVSSASFGSSSSAISNSASSRGNPPKINAEFSSSKMEHSNNIGASEFSQSNVSSFNHSNSSSDHSKGVFVSSTQTFVRPKTSSSSANEVKKRIVQRF